MYIIIVVQERYSECTDLRNLRDGIRINGPWYSSQIIDLEDSDKAFISTFVTPSHQ